jgi:hypothetical protein
LVGQTTIVIGLILNRKAVATLETLAVLIGENGGRRGVKWRRFMNGNADKDNKEVLKKYVWDYLMRKYAWDYFALHSGQRLNTFYYFLTASTIIGTGYFFALKDFPLLSMMLSIVLIILSFIFWKWDVRTKQLIRNSEDALKYLENEGPLALEENHILKLFTFEESQTNKLKNQNSIWPWKAFFSYSTCLNATFSIFGIFGLVGIVYAILSALR